MSSLLFGSSRIEVRLDTTNFDSFSLTFKVLSDFDGVVVLQFQMRFNRLETKTSDDCVDIDQSLLEGYIRINFKKNLVQEFQQSGDLFWCRFQLCN